jgi:hypothetical protein
VNEILPEFLDWLWKVIWRSREGRQMLFAVGTLLLVCMPIAACADKNKRWQKPWWICIFVFALMLAAWAAVAWRYWPE